MNHPFSRLNVQPPLLKWIHPLTCKYFQVSSMETKPSLDPTNYCSVSLLLNHSKIPRKSSLSSLCSHPSEPCSGPSGLPTRPNQISTNSL